MFTTAGAVSRVAVGSETQSKGTYATAAIEFESPLENRELLQSMEGMNVPGGHPAGLKFIDWDTKKHFKLFGKKQRAAVETAGRSAAVVDLADASPGSDQNRDEDSPESRRGGRRRHRVGGGGSRARARHPGLRATRQGRRDTRGTAGGGARERRGGERCGG